MCGRASLTASGEEIAEAFGLEGIPHLDPRYNIAPGQGIAVVRQHAAGRGRTLALLRWGLVPHWSVEPPPSGALINARAESAAVRPAFRDSFRERRCLVPVTGFYEWRGRGQERQPYLIRRRDGALFALAGVWDRWAPPARPALVPAPEAPGPLETCAVLTTEANELVRPLHDRMPVVVPSSAYADWLDTQAAEPGRLQELLRPWPPEDMTAYPVSTRVNAVDNDDPGCLERVPEQPPGSDRQKKLF